MLKWIGLASALSLATTLNTCQPTTSGPATGSSVTDAERGQIEQRIQEYFKKAANLPPNVTLKVTDVTPAPAGLLIATLEASSGTNVQKVPLVLTRDGRYFVQGQLTDLTLDPFQVITSKISLKDKAMRGNPNATVTIVEYSDFQCPFCSRAYHVLEEQVMKNYGDKVRLVYKNFPLPMHAWAENGALASECARQQSPEGFWKMYDFLFQNQSNITPENLKEKALTVVRDAGLNADTFAACLDSKTGLPAVKADQEEASGLGIRSTPTFFINGHKLEGAVPFENFKTIIDQELNKPAAG